MSDSARERIFPFELKKTEGKVALVAGGAGFVGSYVCEQLLSLGFRVICVDNLTSGSKENIESLLNKDDFSFVKADLNSPKFSLPKELKIDAIIHAAGLEEFSIDNDLSLETLLVNSLGTRILLELAKEKKAKFIFISSADLYGGVFSSTSLKYYFGKDAANESTFTYNEAKRFAEALVFEYFKNYDLDAVVVRVKNVYGPRMSFQAEGELNKILAGAVSGKKVTLSGDGLKTINPTYATDVSSGVVMAVVSGSKGEIYNLVSPDKITLDSFVQTTRQVAGSLDISYRGTSEDLEIPYHQLDLSTGQEKLNWRPTVGLADGISHTVTYFRQKGDRPPAKANQTTFSEVRNRDTSNFINARMPHLKHVRIFIFLAALALVVFTVIYPGSALVFNTYRANASFESAVKNLESDRVKEAAVDAEKAEESYQRAAQDLQNLNWLLQIIVSRERLRALDDFYFIGDKFSTAVFHTATSIEILIVQTSGKGPLEEAELQEHLKNISIETNEAKVNYELGVTNLENLQRGSLPKALRDDLETQRKAEATLREILDELSGSTGT